MIEILELKDGLEKNASGMSDDNLRRFILRDDNKNLGSIQFKLIHPKIAFLLSLETTENSLLSVDMIVDGLVRTACHTFQTEGIPLISTELETINKHLLLSTYFTPLEKISEVTRDEKMTTFLNIHHQAYAMNTNMIYQSCCKGV